jgi:hypothetical protein
MPGWLHQLRPGAGTAQGPEGAKRGTKVPAEVSATLAASRLHFPAGTKQTIYARVGIDVSTVGAVG